MPLMWRQPRIAARSQTVGLGMPGRRRRWQRNADDNRVSASELADRWHRDARHASSAANLVPRRLPSRHPFERDVRPATRIAIQCASRAIATAWGKLRCSVATATWRLLDRRIFRIRSLCA